MGLDVELHPTMQLGARARPLAFVADTRDRFARQVSRAQHHGTTPMLDRIDIYGTVELSRAEMPQFLDELTPLYAVASDDGEREVLDAVRRIAEQCRDERLALRLVGD